MNITILYISCYIFGDGVVLKELKIDESMCKNNDLSENKPKIENVIFLGAGASASDGAPIQSKLFEEFFKLSEDEIRFNELKYKKFIEVKNCLANFFKDYFKIDINTDVEIKSFPTFEEVLGCLDLEISKKNIAIKNPENIKENVIYAMAFIIDQKLLNKGENHRTLIKELNKHNILSKTAFISLNYDILIDNALEKCHDFYLDYGTECMNNNENINQKPIQIYKPHGSLNWLFCQECDLIELFPFEKIGIDAMIEPNPCKKCGKKMEPIVIPPTYFKEFEKKYLIDIWRKTETVIKEAKNLYFCGYSFPDADIHIKHLLKRGEINAKPDLNIYVINRSICTDLKERYERFFKSEIYFIVQNFDEFCKNELPNYLDKKRN